MDERDGRAAGLIHRASRRQFDSPEPAVGANREAFDRLSADLAATKAENARLHARVKSLEVIEASTTWRLTRPMRELGAALRPSRPGVSPPAAPPPPHPDAPTYANWIRDVEPAWLAQLAAPRRGELPAARQRLALVLTGPGNPMTASDQQVIYASDLPAECVRVGLDTGAHHLCFLDHRDVLAPGALQLVGDTLARHPALDIVFADEDWLDGEEGRVRPFIKPGWNVELARGRDLLGPFAFLRSDLVRTAVITDGPAWRTDLANQVIARTQPERIGHIPAVLCHRTLAPDEADQRAAARLDLHRRGIPARVERAGDHMCRVVYDLPDPPPLVTLMVPTRDRAGLLQVCADAVLNRTDYPAIELLLIDNGTVEPDALDLMAELARDDRVSVLRQDAAFNWSALNNAGAAVARGDVLLLLNNDIAVLRPDWLTELVRHAMQPGVGAAGAKLLYPDGTVQHAGLTTDHRGIGRHLFRHAPGDSAGPFDLMALARDVWGVTGACLAIRRDVFAAVGGLNEALPVACNDVDLCLRLTASGYRIVWTPWSVVEHRELASRPPDHSSERQAAAGEELARLQRDWGALMQFDPYLHPALELEADIPRFRMVP